MSDHNLAEALREIKRTLMQRRCFGPGDLAAWRTAAVQAESDIEEALAAHEAEQQAGEAVAWHVVDADGQLMHAAGWKEAAHEHINDALNEYGIAEAAKWRVIPVFTHPQQPLAPTEGELKAAASEYWVDDYLDFLSGVRFAKRHYGIGITKDTK